MKIPPLWVPPMRLSPRRILLSVLPAALLVVAAALAVWGENGLLVRHQLDQQLGSAQSDLAAIDGENRRLLRDMRRMHRDPVVMERMVADELGWSREGDTLVQFE